MSGDTYIRLLAAFSMLRAYGKPWQASASARGRLFVLSCVSLCTEQRSWKMNELSRERRMHKHENTGADGREWGGRRVNASAGAEALGDATCKCCEH